MQFLSQAVFLFSMNTKLSISVLSAIMAAFSFSLAAAMVPYFYTAGGSVFLLLCVRYICTLALSSVLHRTPRKQKTKKINARLVLISILQALFIASYMYSIKLIPLSLAVVVIYTFPIITFFANSLIKSRSVDVLSVIALLVSLLGILVMVQGGSSGWNLWGGSSGYQGQNSWGDAVNDYNAKFGTNYTADEALGMSADVICFYKSAC